MSLLILDIIDIISIPVDRLHIFDYLRTCPLEYLEILIKKGVNINHIFYYIYRYW